MTPTRIWRGAWQTIDRRQLLVLHNSPTQMEAVQVLIQPMEESRRIERLAMEERHREVEERRTREMEVKEESRRAEYKAIEEQHRRELHEMLQMQLKLQQEYQNEVWHRQKDLDDSR